MSASVGDIYQSHFVIDLGSGQLAEFNLYYIVTTGNANSGAQDLYNRLNSVVVPELTPLLTTEKEVSAITVINGMDNLDFHEGTPSADGTRSGTPLSTAVACGIRSNRTGPGYEYSHRMLPLGAAADLASSTGRYSLTFKDEVDDLLLVLNNDQVLSGGAEVDPCQITGGFKLGTSPTYRQSLTGTWAMNMWPTYLRSRQNYDWQDAT